MVKVTETSETTKETSILLCHLGNYFQFYVYSLTLPGVSSLILIVFVYVIKGHQDVAVQQSVECKECVER